MMRGTNTIVINPFDEHHREKIIKGVESSKLDVQVTTDENNIVVAIGAIPDDLKNENLQQCKKFLNAAKENIKNIRHECVNELKKLEKILGKDEAKRIEKGILDIFEKANKSLDSQYKRKEDEIKNA